MKRLLVLAALALPATAQIVCTSATSPSALLRAAGLTEQTADLTLVCNQLPGSAAIPANPGNSNLNIIVGVAPALPITSVAVSPGTTEATALTTAGSVQGSVSGSGQVSFQNVPVPGASSGFPACPGPAGCTPFTVTITNLRVDVSALGPGPLALTETALTTSSGFPAIISPSLTPKTTVGIVTNGLTPATVAASSSALTVCGGVTLTSPSFVVTFGETFSTAFKLRGTATGNAVVGAWQGTALNTETGYYIGGNLANSATRVRVDFAGLPATASLYVPLIVPTVAGGGSMTLVTSETGPYAVAVQSTDPGVPAGVARPTVSAGLASAVYEITAQAAGVTTVDNYAVPVYVSLVPFSTATGSAVTVAVSFAAGATGNVPGFAGSSSAVPAMVVAGCATTLLFPYVTNGNGFDTGLAIANTTATPTANPRAVQSGTCTLAFFGANAPRSVTTVAIQGGTEYLNTLSTLAPGFTGYLIARCNFLSGYGFAYLSHNLIRGDGVSMGYLSLVIPR